jgi:hypothetical protein
MPLYKFLYNLMIAFVQIANKMGLQNKKNRRFRHDGSGRNRLK